MYVSAKTLTVLSVESLEQTGQLLLDRRSALKTVEELAE